MKSMCIELLLNSNDFGSFNYLMSIEFFGSRRLIYTPSWEMRKPQNEPLDMSRTSKTFPTTESSSQNQMTKCSVL